MTSASRKRVQESTQNTNKNTAVISTPGTTVMEKNNHVGMPTKTYKTIEEDEEELPCNTLATALFHILMLFASFYLAMILTNWGAPNLANNKENYIGFSKEWLGFGMKLTAQWAATSIFIWSLVAPKMCPNRELA